MPITYTNRKGHTYHLCQGVTRTGKPRYYFARTPPDTPVEQIPEGFEVQESINGVVSLAKARPCLIAEAEVEAVRSALKAHPKPHRYRLEVKDDRITIYEQSGSDRDGFLTQMAKDLGLPANVLQRRVEKTLTDNAQYSPIMRFLLVDPVARTFHTQRMCFRSSIDGWLDLPHGGPLLALAERLIPTLGTDDFYELF